MTNLLQILRRKVSEVRIRQKASEIRHRSCGLNDIGTLPRSLEFHQPRSAPGYYSDRRITVVKTTPTGSKNHAGFR